MPSHRNHSPSRHVARGTLQLIIGRIFFFVFGYFVSIILARGLGPIEYGLYGVIMSVLVWAEQIGRLGIPDAVAKLSPEDEERRPQVENTSHTLLMIIYTLLFVLFWLSSPALVRFFHIPDATNLFRLAIIDIPFSGLYFTYQGILVGRREFGVLSGSLAVYGLAKLVGILIAIIMGLSLFWALLANVLGTLGGLLFLSFYISPKIFHPSFVHINLILRLAFPIGLLLLALQILLNLDLWFLKYVDSEREAIIGTYVAALNIAKLPTLFFAMIHGVILPSLSMALARQDIALTRRYIHGGGRFLWITLLPSCVLLAFTAEELLVILYSDRYVTGATFLILQVSGHALFGFAQLFSSMLIAQGKPYLAAGAALCLIPVALVLNFTLIHNFGAMGASTALALTGFFAASISGFLVFHRFGSLIQPTTLLKAVLATVLMAFVAIHLTHTGLWLIPKYLLLLSLYCIVLAILGELTWDDLHPFVFWREERA
jgi:O-antigen/teichoic acid export membrane protein